jgi:hypothetical protein
MSVLRPCSYIHLKEIAFETYDCILMAFWKYVYFDQFH